MVTHGQIAQCQTTQTFVMSLWFKGIVPPKLKSLSLFSHRHVIQNTYDLLFLHRIQKELSHKMSKVLFSRQSGGVVTIHILNVSLLMVALLEWDFDDACPMATWSHRIPCNDYGPLTPNLWWHHESPKIPRWAHRSDTNVNQWQASARGPRTDPLVVTNAILGIYRHN